MSPNNFECYDTEILPFLNYKLFFICEKSRLHEIYHYDYFSAYISVVLSAIHTEMYTQSGKHCVMYILSQRKGD